ncbi:hypothetical protein [Segatella hominis]|uniref:hypothetical protein n=1 Tax=Segatella hominis TaxID=2518605 RepID=UPI001F1866EC|nr:hypothetical protein [Segatella hominis]
MVYFWLKYDAKKKDQTRSAKDMGFYRYKDLPSNRTPYLIDNVVEAIPLRQLSEHLAVELLLHLL